VPRNADVVSSWARRFFRPARRGWLAFFVSRRAAYQEVFRGAARAVVLADLAQFCHAQATTHVIGDTHGSAQLEGRRQVWLRIRGYLALSDDELDEMRRQALASEEGAVQ
jgi:sigma54-dependent transcription regulator